MLRIGELSRRVGVSHALAAGLGAPVRARCTRSAPAGGYRLYSQADENRVRHMQAHLTRGLSAAEAARAALDEKAATCTGSDAGQLAHRQGLAAAARALT